MALLVCMGADGAPQARAGGPSCSEVCPYSQEIHSGFIVAGRTVGRRRATLDLMAGGLELQVKAPDLCAHPSDQQTLWHLPERLMPLAWLLGIKRLSICLA